jgi:hypothetical protein
MLRALDILIADGIAMKAMKCVSQSVVYSRGSDIEIVCGYWRLRLRALLEAPQTIERPEGSVSVEQAKSAYLKARTDWYELPVREDNEEDVYRFHDVMTEAFVALITAVRAHVERDLNDRIKQANTARNEALGTIAERNRELAKAAERIAELKRTISASERFRAEDAHAHITDTIEWAKERKALKTELQQIDLVLGNRLAFDSCKTRVEKIRKAIDIACVADPNDRIAKAEAELSRLRQDAATIKKDVLYDMLAAIPGDDGRLFVQGYIDQLDD